MELSGYRSKSSCILLKLLKNIEYCFGRNFLVFEYKRVELVVCSSTYRTSVSSGVIDQNAGSILKNGMTYSFLDILQNNRLIVTAIRTRKVIGVQDNCNVHGVVDILAVQTHDIGAFKVEQFQNSVFIFIQKNRNCFVSSYGGQDTVRRLMNK